MTWRVFADGIVALVEDVARWLLRAVLWTFVVGGLVGLLLIGWRAL